MLWLATSIHGKKRGITPTDLKQVSNEVRGLRGYFLPWVRRIHESRVLDLLAYVLVLVERERAGEAHLEKEEDDRQVREEYFVRDTKYPSLRYSWDQYYKTIFAVIELR